MADIALVTSNKVDVVESYEQHTLPCAEAVAPGDVVRMDTSTGRWTKSNATSAAEARVYGVAVGGRAVAAGEPITAVRRGKLDGFNLDALAYGAAIFLSDTDGKMADAAGTTSVTVGRVLTATANLISQGHHKILLVHL